MNIGAPAQVDLAPADWMKIMRRAEAMPQIERLDQFIADASRERDQWQRSLDASPDDRRTSHPKLHEAARQLERRRHEQTRIRVGVASMAVTLGVTCLTGLNPCSGLACAATLLGLPLKIYDRFALPRVEQRTDGHVVAALQAKRDKADAQVQRFETNRRKVYERGLARFSTEPVARGADPSARVEHGEEALLIAGVRVPKRDAALGPRGGRVVRPPL